MKRRFLGVLAVISAVLTLPAAAHHSFNTFFDMSRTIEIEGVVTSFRLVSPHSEMLIDVPNAEGEAITWRITALRGRNGHGCGRGHVRGGRQGRVPWRLPRWSRDRVERLR